MWALFALCAVSLAGASPASLTCDVDATACHYDTSASVFENCGSISIGATSIGGAGSQVSFLGAPVSQLLVVSTNTSTTYDANTHTLEDWDVIVQGTHPDSPTVGGSNDELIYANADGLYELTTHVTMTARSSDSCRGGVYIYKNGVVVTNEEIYSNCRYVPVVWNHNTRIELVDGDYLSILWVGNYAGISTSVCGADDELCYLSLMRVPY